MSTMTEDRDNPPPAPLPLQDAELVAMPRCKRCNLTYIVTKSTSALKLTYCSFLCELGDLGFSMTGLETMQRKPRQAPAEKQPEPVAIE